jgi:hypothetical protein
MRYKHQQPLPLSASARNLCTFMALGVRACLQSVDVYLVLIGFYVSLESLQIQNQGRRCQFAQTARLSY